MLYPVYDFNNKQINNNSQYCIIDYFQLGGLGEHCKFTQRGLGQSPGLDHFVWSFVGQKWTNFRAFCEFQDSAQASRQWFWRHVASKFSQQSIISIPW